MALAPHGMTPAEAQLTFNFVDAAGNPAADTIDPVAVAGFEAAGDRWSALFADDITVNIEIDFDVIPSATGATILGATGASIIDSAAELGSGFPTFSLLKNQLDLDATSNNDLIALANLPDGNPTTIAGGPVTDSGLILDSLSFRTNDRAGNFFLDDDTAVGAGDTTGINNTLFAITSANAKAIGLVPADDPGVDATITFNSTIAFDFDPSDGITPGTTDFVGIATHELAHALGFVSGVDTVDALSGVGPSADLDINGAAAGLGELDPFAIFSTVDLFRRSEAATALDPDALDLSNDPGVFFSIDGDLSDGDDIPLETGSFNGTGFMASHFLDDLGLGILDPTVGPGELLIITANDVLAFDVIGYDLIDPVLLGDFKGDGLVGQADLDLVLLNFGGTVLPAGFDPAAGPGGGPFDGAIGQDELDAILLRFGDGTPPEADGLVVPEPAGLTALAILGQVMNRRRRRIDPSGA
ncbi:MAG: NF038122 family metalloprotease [Planctomycetota bacterium]